MIIRIFPFILVFLLTTTAFGQNKEKLYYNKDWKSCPKSEAEFYRLVTFDAKGNPLGKVYDYYITGELQGVADGALVIGREDDRETLFTGTVKTYHKNGCRVYKGQIALRRNCV